MRISKSSREFIKREYCNDFYTYMVCGLALLVLGIISFWCTINIENKNFYILTIVFISVSAMILGIAIFIGGLFASAKKRKAFRKYIEGFSFGVESSAKAAILSFPNPIVIVSADGTIQWYNSEFTTLCGRENLFGTDLKEIFPSLRLSDFTGEKKVVREFSYNGRDFLLSGELSRTELDDSSITLIGISFEDVSEVKRLQTRLEEKRSVVCTAVIDNYDEVLKETPNANHGALLGDVERCISLWVERGQGFYRKYERDKFIILFESAKFEPLLNEKFSILNDVKEVDQQNKIPVTLSIGVGMISDDIEENDRISLSALDMALGRGGDQAVVKSVDGYLFYGAKSLGVEKTTKVKARVVAKSLCSLIDNASNVVVMGHTGSDFDAFGAAAGIFRAALNRGKKGYIILDRNHNNVGELVKDFIIQDEYANGIIGSDKLFSLIDEKTLLIVVDTHRPSMVECPDVLRRIKDIVLIDHHRRSEEFIDNIVLAYHEPYASSASEMVVELLQYMDDDKGLSVLEAEALYCGIYLDTKCFTFKTGARTFEAAAYLRKIGVDPVRVHKMFRNDISMYIQKSRVISSAKIYRDNIAIAVCEETSKNVQLVVAQAADDLLNINGVEASFVLANVGNRTIISGRSLGAVNVQVILEKLGGGGHITIAGAQIDNNSLAIAELKLHNAIDEALFE